MKIPVTIVSGFLGAGKTTLILNLIKQLPKDYNAVWLKNEYGDVNIDSELAKESNIKTTEVLNGCLCCVLVGKIQDALKEILEKYNPDRIIIETAGTAYPYSIILEIEKIEKLYVDGVIQVIDAINFKGFKDKSIVAKMQADYTDLIVINKTNEIDEDELDQRLDDVYDLYLETPKIKTKDGFVEKDLLIGLDHKQIATSFSDKGRSGGVDHIHHHESDFEVEVFSFDDSEKIFDLKKLEDYLESLSNYDFIRIKGIVRAEDGYYLLNYVFGKINWQKLEKYNGPTKITFMGENINNLEVKIKKEVLKN